MEGVMSGHDMLLFVDLSRTAIERVTPIVGLGLVLDGDARTRGTHTGGVV